MNAFLLIYIYGFIVALIYATYHYLNVRKNIKNLSNNLEDIIGILLFSIGSWFAVFWLYCDKKE